MFDPLRPSCVAAWSFTLLMMMLPDNAARGQAVQRSVIVPAGTELRTFAQNWTSDEANWFYNVPQGSKLLPYAWFLHLEQPDVDGKLLRDSAHIQSLGYLPRDPGSGNPDGLPVGFVKDDDHLGLTCAACHTGLMTYKGRSWLIDGGPTLGDVSRLQREIATALEQTQTGDKFQRFAKDVLGPAATDADKILLKKNLADVLKTRSEYNKHNLPQSGETPFGPGRVDAFGAILNQVTTQIAGVPGNAQPANAPVSYPFLWDTPHHDRVQWNGAAKNSRAPLLAALLGTEHVGALGRNTGEVLGVFGRANAQVEELLVPRGYTSSVKTANLIEIEDTVRKLQSPVWPAEFGLIDESLRAPGEALFAKHCAACHHEIRRDDENRRVIADLRAVGTDQAMAANFATRTAKAGLFGRRLVKIPGLDRFSGEDREPVSDFLVHAVQRVLLGSADKGHFVPTALAGYDLNYSVAAEVQVANTKLRAVFRDLDIKNGLMTRGSIVLSDEPSDLLLSRDGHSFRLNQQSLQEKVRLLHDKVQEWDLHKLVTPDIEFTSDHRIVIHLKPVQEAKVVFAYKGRPLNGIWATAPYLHNGSVPTLDELLKPATKRVKKFGVGNREFDPIRVGYRTDAAAFEYDTSLPGNSNAGHEYGDVIFTDDHRKQLIEYMKSL
jgi:hypothetical protein